MRVGPIFALGFVLAGLMLVGAYLFAIYEQNSDLADTTLNVLYAYVIALVLSRVFGLFD